MRVFDIAILALGLVLAGFPGIEAEKEASRNSQTKVDPIFPSFHGQLNQMLDSILKTTNSEFVKMESANTKAKQLYNQRHRANGDDSHTIVVAIKQRNMETLERILHEVSNPQSEKYGQHMSNEEVAELTSNPEAAAHVVSYLQQQGIEDMVETPHGDYITVTAPIKVLEKVLNCEFYVYTALEKESFEIIRTDEYYLEAHVAKHVAAVFHTIHFPPTHYIDNGHKTKILGEGTTAINFHGYVTPTLLKRFYHIDTTLGNSLASQAVYESIGQTYSPSDLSYFQRTFNLTVETVKVDIGGHVSDRMCRQSPNDCVEANLDVQYLMAVAPHVPTTYYYWGGEDFMVDWLVQVAAMHNPPKVISISYGMEEQYLTASYAEIFTVQSIKVSVQGVTITASSGDDGAPGSGARKNSFMCGYHPSFPASSPYVTAVGGTMGPELDKVETACQSDHGGVITTGGGFSTLYSTPTWQSSYISSYLNRSAQSSITNPLIGFNRNGRGYPDVSALAFNYVIALSGNLTLVSGTSASSPVFAGMISLVNSARLAAGKSTLGWLNPALYEHASSFVKDVKSGDNRCAADAEVCCGHGFFASDGWDPVTGLGSVDFPTFKTTMLALGRSVHDPSLSPTPAPLGPTRRPTRSPTAEPSRKPTAAPSMSRGWMYIRQYEREQCGGRVITQSSVPTDTCLQLYDSDQSIAGSVKYVCNGDRTARIIYFGDKRCKTPARDSTVYMGCAYRVANYYDSTDYFSTEVNCEAFPDPFFPPVSSYDGKYAIQQSFNSITGCDGSVSSVEAILQHFCFDLPQQSLSYEFSYPNILVYSGSNCRASKLTSTNPLNTDCEASTGTYSYDYSYGYGDSNAVSTTDLENLADLLYRDTRSVRREEVNRIPAGTIGRLQSLRILRESKLQSDGGYYSYSDSSTDMFNIWSLANTAPLTFSPSLTPTLHPTIYVPVTPSTHYPTSLPTPVPTSTPTSRPTSRPTAIPTATPTATPTAIPTAKPTSSPSMDAIATLKPAVLSTASPVDEVTSMQPSIKPSARPTPSPPSRKPSLTPSYFPTQTPTTLSPSPLPTPSPTLVPSLAPIDLSTVMPISISPLTSNFSITLQQDLLGVSMQDWLSDIKKNFAVFAAAVATVLELKTSNELVFVAASAIPSALKLELKSKSVQIYYQVLINLDEVPFSTVTDTVQSVQNTLQTSVQQGGFDASLRQYAQAMQSTALLSAASGYVKIVSVEEISSGSEESTEGDSGHKKDSRVVGAIVGLVLVFLVLAGVGGLVGWNKVKKYFTPAYYSHVSLNSDSMHGSIYPNRNNQGGDEDGEVEIEFTTQVTHVQPPAETFQVKGRLEVVNPLTANSSASHAV